MTGSAASGTGASASLLFDVRAALIAIDRAWARAKALRWPRRRVVIAWAMALGAIGGIALFSAWAMSRAAPAWWRGRQASDARTAEDLENGVVSQFSLVRPADPAFVARPGQSWQSERWSVSLQVGDANAWLNERLPRWVATQQKKVKWPEEVREIQAEFRDGAIHVGTKLRTAAGERFVAVTLRPRIEADGSLWLPADGAQLGTLPLPASLVIEWAGDAVAGLFAGPTGRVEETRTALEAFAGRHAMVDEPVVRLEGGRRVRLLGLAVREGRLELTFRTEKK